MTYQFSKRKVPKLSLLNTLIAATLSLSLQLGASAPATAQSVCMTHAEVEKQLGTNFAESPIALGLASNGSVFEIFSKADGTSWTMVITQPNGVSCLLAEGEAWESVPRNEEVALGPQT
jgi:hypothetical protein